MLTKHSRGIATRGGDLRGLSGERRSYRSIALTLGVAAGLLVPLLPQGVQANSTSKLTVRGAITSISVNPNLTLTLAVDKPTALPGDTLAYSGTATHTGITACVNGSLTAQNTGTATATVVDFFDEIDYWDPNALKWVPLAGVVNTQTAFVPVVTPRISTGITLTVTSAPASGVTYPSSGNPILGTTIAPGATAAWTGSACITLTAAQLNALFSAPKLEVETHFEDTPGDPSGESWTSDQPCINPVQSGSLNARNVVVTVTPPSGPAVQITSSTVPVFASLGVGASATYATTYRVPASTSRGSNETEAVYIQRLTGLDGSSLKAIASVTATGPTGPVSANAPPVSTIEHLPILGIIKSGPATHDAGTTVSYQLALQNKGSATASQLTVSDTLSDGGSGTVGNVPGSLAPSATSTATASYAIPAATQPGTLTDTAAVTWNDPNGNVYGSVSGSFGTRVTINGVPPEIQPVTSTVVQGNFFAEPASALTFVAVKGDTPAFSQNFPTINFNPPGGVVPHNISGVGPKTRPFTDVTTDLVGNFAGTIPAQGGGNQAGVGSLQSFDAALQASFIVQTSGDVTFVIYHDDGFILGIGNAATRVSGVYVGPPAATAFAGYPVLGAFNQMVAAPRTDEVTVHFPAPGIYPYELDYFEAGADSLTLTLTTAPAPSGSTGTAAGGVFVTGHDPDFHAVQGPNQAGAQHIIQRAIATVTRAKANPKVLLVMDLQDPGSGSSDPRSGMTAAGFTTFDIADYGSGAAGVLDLRTVAFANYDLIVVASDFGGWLRQAELSVLDGRASDIARYISQGGGLVAFAESGASGLTATGRFGFIPCLNAISGGGGESGFQLTSLGQAIGLVATDVNSNFYHNVFASPCGMDVVDFDTAGRPVSLTSTGVSRSWNIAHDFQLAPNQANPSNGGVWSYLQAGSNALDPSSYTKLPNFTSQAYSTAGLQQWTGSFASGGRADDLLPAAGVNASGASQHPLTFVWPNGVFRLHPWTAAVVVGWTSPFSGTVHVEGAVTHLDQSCGDGVRWNVLSGSNKLASGQVTFGANAGQFLSEGTGGASLNQISVTTGQSLYFVVDAGANGDFFCDSTALDVTVVEGPALNTRPLPPSTTLLIQPASTGATVGQGVNLTVSAMDGTGAPVAGVPVTVTVSGVNSIQQTVSTDAAGLARIAYVSVAAGTDQVTATGNLAGRLSVSNSATVSWTVPGPDPSLLPPTITAPSPADGAIVTRPTPITATISPPSGQTIASWSVTYQAQDVEPIVTLASGTGAPPSTLATFDPTLLPNDTYAIAISATASGGGIQTLTTTVAVFGNLKLGRYVTTYQDLSVPVNGFQMQVRRTYDSIDKRVGDFGIGWHVDLVNFRVSANRQLGAGGWTEYPTSCIFGLCFYGFKTSAPHYVTVTFPDQHQEVFDFTPQGGAGILYWQGNAAFTARPGTGTMSTLEVSGDSSLSYDFAGNLVGGTGYFNPTRFKLTTRDGRVLIVDTVLGLLSATDRNANSLTIDGTGVHASNGQSISYTRDSLNRITQVTGPVAGEVFRYGYSASGDLQTYTDANGNVTTFGYDANHNLLSANGPGGRPLHTLAYDAAGRLATITDGNGNPVQIHSDAGTQQQVITSAGGRLNTVDFLDDVGDVVREDQVFGGATQTTRWTYDANGNVLTRRDPLGNSWSAQYDAKGNLVQYTSAAQQQTNYTYDSFGQLTSVRGPGGRLLEAITYDASGNAVQIQNGDQPGSTYAYDGSSRLTKITDPAGRSTQLAYDANGNLATATANSGQSWSFQIDASGRLVSRTDPLGATTSFTYDGNGQLTSIKDAANTIVRTYAYDSNGDVTSETDALGSQVTYSYDAGFRQTGITDRAGRHITYAYDADGNLTSEALPGTDVTTYTYDPLNRLVDALNANAEVSLAYDAAGRLVSQTTRGTASSPQPTVALAYSYDAEGRLVTLSGPEGQANYAYDALSRLTSVTDPARGVFNFGYDGNQRLTSLTRPNGVNDNAVYDASDFLTQLTSSLNANPIAQVVFAADPNGQRQSQTDLVGKHSFTRDATGQLTNTIHPAGGLAAESYKYDSRGNRTATATPGSIVYDSRDRLVSDPTASYTYDADGNLVSRVDTVSARTTTYDWNANHQLLAVHFPDSTAATYRYDPFGRRIEVNDRGTITRYAYDAENLHLEYDATNTLAAVYTNGIDINSVLEMTRGGQSYYYLKDGLGSTTALVNGAGTVSTSYTYDSFGRQTSAGNVPNPITYAGGQFDASSGLYYFRARYYDPAAGRFISEDPVESPNPYIYARNDPADFADPLGEQAAPEYGLLQSAKARLYAVFATIGRLLARIYRCIGEMIQIAVSLAGMYSSNDTGGNRLPPNRIDSPPTNRGNAPTGDDGKPVELHHRGQQSGSPLDEMTQTDHRIGDNYAKNHPNTGQEDSKIDRGKWGNQQKNYWKNEWDRGRWARGCR